MIDEKKLIERFRKLRGIETLSCMLIRDVIKEIKEQPKIGGWIPCSERLPNMEEVYKNDGRFILDDGNRRYQGIFDYTEKKFVRFDFFCGMQEDKCAIAWQPLPEAYHEQVD